MLNVTSSSRRAFNSGEPWITACASALRQYGGIVEIFGDPDTHKSELAGHLAAKAVGTERVLIYNPTGIGQFGVAADMMQPRSLEVTFGSIPTFTESMGYRAFILAPLPAFYVEEDSSIAYEFSRYMRKNIKYIFERRLLMIIVNHLHYMPNPETGTVTPFTPGGLLLQQLTCLRIQTFPHRIPSVVRNTLRIRLLP